MTTPGSWIILHEHGMKIYGIVTAVDAGNISVITSLGEYSRPCSFFSAAPPHYQNPELQERLFSTHKTIIRLTKP